MAYPDTITLADSSVDGGTSRSLKTIEWLAAQLTPLLTTIRDNGVALNSYATTYLPYYLPTTTADKNERNVKVGGGSVTGAQGKNTLASTDLLLHIFDKATAPVVGTDAAKKVVPLPANSVFSWDWPAGVVCAFGVGFAITTEAGAAVAVGDVKFFNLDIY